MRFVTFGVLAALIAILTASLASAQDRSRGAPPDEDHAVRTVNATAPIKGRLLDVTPETLSILVKGQRIEIPMTTVSAIDVGGDPVGNGAAIGAGIAAVLMGSLCASVKCDAQFIPGMVLYVGMGALAGAGVDAMNTKQTTVFRKSGPAPSTGAHPSVAFKFRF